MLYLVGHGLYVPPQPSQSFPVGLSDDVALGYVLSGLGEAVNATSAAEGCDISQAPVSLQAHIRQARRWMAGDYAATGLLAWPCRLKRRVELHATWTHRFVTVAGLLGLSIPTAGTAPLTVLFSAWFVRATCRLFAIRHYLGLVPHLTGPYRHAKFALGVALKAGLDSIAWVGVRGALRDRTTNAMWLPSAKDEAACELRCRFKMARNQQRTRSYLCSRSTKALTRGGRAGCRERNCGVRGPRSSGPFARGTGRHDRRRIHVVRRIDCREPCDLSECKRRHRTWSFACRECLGRRRGSRLRPRFCVERAARRSTPRA